MSTSTIRVRVITLGTARFGQLQGGPFDGRCYPLGEGTPEVLHVPVDGAPRPGEAPRTMRYALHDGLYRYVAQVPQVASAA